MSVRELIIQAPHLSEASWPEKKAIMAELAWAHEMAGKGFGQVEGESILERIAFLLDWPCQKEDVRKYCLQLLHLCALSHAGNEHGDTEAAIQAIELKAVLEPQEALHPEVAKVMTVAEAYGGWWGE
jgi:hypothetical protein